MNNFAKQYIAANKILTPLTKKRLPKLKKWNTVFLTETELNNHDSFFGWVLGDKDLVIDVDPRNGGVESYKKLLDDLGLKKNIDLVPTVKTARGGTHYYLSIPDSYLEYNFKKVLNNYQGIDFLSKGSYCVISGSVTDKGSYAWNDPDFGCFEQREAPESILELIKKPKLVRNSEDHDFFDDLVDEYNKVDKNFVDNFLEKLDNNMPYSDWVRVGMALHNWSENEGLEIWENWSKGALNYEVGKTEEQWGKFEKQKGVTLGTISYMAKSADFDKKTKEVDDFVKIIRSADQRDLNIDIMPKIKKSDLDDFDRETLAHKIKMRFKELTSVTHPIKKIRDKIYNVSKYVPETDTPEWCRTWVYINSHSKFANLNNLEMCKAEAFNMINGKHVPVNENNNKISATKYVSDNSFIQVINSVVYLPYENEKIVMDNDKLLLNMFNPNSVPKPSKKFSKEGLKLIETVKKHLNFLCSGDDENAKILMMWIAHNIQFMGKQILWTPVIQGIEGIGKSLIGAIFRACLGDSNVGVVSPSQAGSQYNGWAQGVVVNILEELRISGKNRYEGANNIKTLITDKYIQINDKSVSQYRLRNVTNYICFTNEKDCVPLTETDRRYWVIFADVASVSDLENFIGCSAKEYFPKLFTDIEIYGEELKKFFLEYEITEDFKKTKQAPMTKFKESMVATEKLNVEGLTEVVELLSKGGDYFNKEFFSSSDMFAALEFEYPNLELNNYKKNRILKRLGYTCHPKIIKIDGVSKRIWMKKWLDIQQVREKLLTHSL